MQEKKRGSIPTLLGELLRSTWTHLIVGEKTTSGTIKRGGKGEGEKEKVCFLINVKRLSKVGTVNHSITGGGNTHLLARREKKKEKGGGGGGYLSAGLQHWTLSERKSPSPQELHALRLL